MRSFIFSVLKHPKMNNVTQTLFHKTPLPNTFFFFLDGTQAEVEARTPGL